jgi:REP element-mobilizing transposase RayT
MRELPVRKPNRLSGYDYSQNGAYFVTICTRNREKLFGKIVGATVPGRPCMELSELGKIINSAIVYYNASNENMFAKYVIMPNHIHLIIDITQSAGDRGRSPLHNIVRNLKSFVTKNAGFSPWQKSFHDHIIRCEQDFIRIAEYIENNPLTWEQDCFYQ